MSESFGSILKRERIRANISVKEISEKLILKGFKAGISAIYNWENDISQPSPDILLNICREYGIADILDTFGYSGSDLYSFHLTSTGRRIGHLYEIAKPNDQKVVETVLSPYDDGTFIPAETKKAPTKGRNDNIDNDGFVSIKVYDQPSAAGLGNYLDAPVHHEEQYPSHILPTHVDFGVRISGDSMEPLIHNGQVVFVQSCLEIPSGKVGVFNLNGEAYCKRLEVDRDSREVRLVSVNPNYEDIVITEHDELRTMGLVV